MKNFAKWMLGAAVLAGGLGLSTTSAQAAQFRVVVGDGPAYVPPCPGPGYAWVAGYYNDGYWVPGYWNYVGAGYGYYRHDDDGFRYRGDDHGGYWRHDDDRGRGYGQGNYYGGRDEHHDGNRWRR